MMFIAIDIGNTMISIAAFKGARIQTVHQLESKLAPKILRDKLARMLNHYRSAPIDRVMVCSVVPPVAKIVESVTLKVLGKKALIVGKDIVVPIRNRYTNPRQVGQDRLVCAYAAAALYGAPAIVIDLGTAITVDVVSAKTEYQGGIIIPGLRLSAESLFQKTALLPMVDIHKPVSLIGKDTQGSILSGLFYGYGQMLQGLIVLLSREIKGKPKVIVTGGYAKLMQKFIANKVDVIEPHLVFKGMALI